MSKAGRAEGVLGTRPPWTWGFFQPWPTDGPLLVLSLVLSPAQLTPGCPQLPLSRAQPLLASSASVACGASPRSPRVVGCLGSLLGVPGNSQSNPPTHTHGLCWGQCCTSLADSVHHPSHVTEEGCSRTHLALEETQPMCLAIPKCREQLWQGHDAAAHVSVPLGSNPSVCPFAQPRTWVPEGDLAEGLQGTLPATSCQGGSFFPWESPSSCPSDVRWGSKLLHPAPAAGTPVGTTAVPRGGGHPSRHWPGSGTTGTAGACAQRGGELTGLIFSRLHSALTCDPRYRKDAASALSPGAAWLDLVGRGKSTSWLFRPTGVASNGNLISP